MFKIYMGLKWVKYSTFCGWINTGEIFTMLIFANQRQEKLYFAILIFANYGDLKKVGRLDFAMDGIK